MCDLMRPSAQGRCDAMHHFPPPSLPAHTHESPRPLKQNWFGAMCELQPRVRRARGPKHTRAPSPQGPAPTYLGCAPACLGSMRGRPGPLPDVGGAAALFGRAYVPVARSPFLEAAAPPLCALKLPAKGQRARPRASKPLQRPPAPCLFARVGGCGGVCV